MTLKFNALVAIAVLAIVRPSVAAESLYDSVVKNYMTGEWDSVEKDLAAKASEINHLPEQQKADIAYIKQAIHEGHPDWWKQAKAGKKFVFHTKLFNDSITATYSPQLRGRISIVPTSSGRQFTVNWSTNFLDNPSPGSHNFANRDLYGCLVWNVLADVPVEMKTPMTRLTEPTPEELAREIALKNKTTTFYEQVTAVVYGTPRMRQIVLWNGTLNFAEQENGDGRRCIGSAFLAELAANRAQYASVPLRNPLPPMQTEKLLGGDLHFWVETHQLTFAEDRLMREALRKFALANSDPRTREGRVKLNNGLEADVDQLHDEAVRPQRDAWLLETLSKAPVPATAPVQPPAPVATQRRPNPQAQRLLAAAQDFVKNKQPEQARQKLEIILKYYPTDPEAVTAAELMNQLRAQ